MFVFTKTPLNSSGCKRGKSYSLYDYKSTKKIYSLLMWQHMVHITFSKVKKLGICDELKEKFQRRNWNSDKLIDLSM